MRLLIALAVLFAATLAASGALAQAEDPQIIYRFTGQALIGGEPAAQGTVISATIGDQLVGTTTVDGGKGRWSMEIGAWHLRAGVCEAVFHLAGEPAGKQTVNCQVDVLLETGGGAEAPRSAPDAAADDDHSELVSEVESTVEGEDHTSTVTVEVTAAAAHEQAEPVLQPRTPRTGTGGLDRSSPWPALLGALGVALVGLLSLARPFRSMRRRRP